MVFGTDGWTFGRVFGKVGGGRGGRRGGGMESWRWLVRGRWQIFVGLFVKRMLGADFMVLGLRMVDVCKGGGGGGLGFETCQQC